MDFICACLLLFLWYVRPQDIFAVIGGVSVVKYLMYAGILATLRRPGGFSISKLFVTPIDWLVGAYCLWAIYVTTPHMDAAKEVFTYFSFHMVVALALTNWKRIETFINWWLGCLGVLAVLALSLHWGFELVAGSAQLTSMFHDRLTLNTWVFRNPNALGHGVMTLIPAGVSWFMMSGSKNRPLGMVAIVLAMHCLYLTESKGAFLACAGGLTLLLLFKRPAALQIIILVTAYAVGLAALKSLPRMNTLSKDDQGIQGRMIVWQQAKSSMESTRTGEGLKAFHGYVAVRIAKLHRTINVPIATHGSYVRHGADLGYVGLMLFAGAFYLGARLTLQARTTADGAARRVHRTLYTLVIATAISCWVVDRAYHMDYFLLTGLLSAFHRRFLAPESVGDVIADEEKAKEEGLKLGAPALALPPKASAPSATATAAVAAEPSASLDIANRPAPVGGKASALAGGKPTAASGATESSDANADGTEPDEHGVIRLKWTRLGFLDLVMMYVLLEVVLYYWDLFSTDFVAF